MEFRIPKNLDDLEQNDDESSGCLHATDVAEAAIEPNLVREISRELGEKDLFCVQEQETFNKLYSAVKCFDQLDSSSKDLLIDSLATNLSCLVPSIASFLASSSGSSSTSAADADVSTSGPSIRSYKNCIKIYSYFLACIVKHAALAKATENADRPAQKVRHSSSPQGGRQSRRKAVVSHSWEWQRQMPKVLKALATATSVKLSALYHGSTPEESLMEAYCSLAFTLFDDAELLKNGDVRAPLVQIVAQCAVKQGYLVQVVSGLLHLLHHQKHSPDIVTDVVVYADEHLGQARLAAAVLQDVGRTGLKEYSRANSGVHEVAEFLVGLANKQPRLLAASLPLLVPHLEHGESAVLRCAIVTAISRLLARLYSADAGAAPGGAGSAPGDGGAEGEAEEGDEAGEGGRDSVEEEGPAARGAMRARLQRLRSKQGLLAVLMERARDQSAHVRSRVMQAWAWLCGEKAVPLGHWNAVAELAVGRLEDKSSLVRKNALQRVGGGGDCLPLGHGNAVAELAVRRLEDKSSLVRKNALQVKEQGFGVLLGEMLHQNPFGPSLRVAPFEVTLEKARVELAAMEESRRRAEQQEAREGDEGDGDGEGEGEGEGMEGAGNEGAGAAVEVGESEGGVGDDSWVDSQATQGDGEGEGEGGKAGGADGGTAEGLPDGAAGAIGVADAAGVAGAAGAAGKAVLGRSFGVEQTRTLVASLSAGLQFCRLLAAVTGALAGLLGSSAVSDVEGAILLLTALQHFRVDGACERLKKILPLVFSHDPAVRAAVEAAVLELHVKGRASPFFFLPSPSPLQVFSHDPAVRAAVEAAVLELHVKGRSAQQAARSLVALTHGASSGDLAALEVLVGTFVHNGDVTMQMEFFWRSGGTGSAGGHVRAQRRRHHADVIPALRFQNPWILLSFLLSPFTHSLHQVAILWDIFTFNLPGATSAESTGALILLSMAAKTRPEILNHHLSALLAIGLGRRAQSDPLLALYTCIALQRVSEEARKEMGAGHRAALEHLVHVERLVRRIRAARAAKEKAAAEAAAEAMEAGLSGKQAKASRKSTGRKSTVSVTGKRRSVAATPAAYEYESEEDEAGVESVDVREEEEEHLGDGREDKMGEELGTAVTADAQLEALQEQVEGEIVAMEKGLERRRGEGREYLVGRVAWFVSALCRRPQAFAASQGVYVCAVLSLSKLMAIDSHFCESHLQLLFTLLRTHPHPSVRANAMVALGDLALRCPNLLQPWTPHAYTALSDGDAFVRRQALLVLSHLILNDMMKGPGRSGLALPQPAAAMDAPRVHRSQRWGCLCEAAGAPGPLAPHPQRYDEDLALRCPNLLQPWTPHAYTALSDGDAFVRRQALLVLSHLILYDMMKVNCHRSCGLICSVLGGTSAAWRCVWRTQSCSHISSHTPLFHSRFSLPRSHSPPRQVKGHISSLAVCLEDPEPRNADLARLFFHELSKKGSSLVYNLLPDMLSHMAVNPRLSEPSLHAILRFLIAFIDKDKQREGLIDKLCHRFTNAHPASSSAAAPTTAASAAASTNVSGGAGEEGEVGEFTECDSGVEESQGGSEEEDEEVEEVGEESAGEEEAVGTQEAEGEEEEGRVMSVRRRSRGGTGARSSMSSREVLKGAGRVQCGAKEEVERTESGSSSGRKSRSNMKGGRAGGGGGGRRRKLVAWSSSEEESGEEDVEESGETSGEEEEEVVVQRSAGRRGQGRNQRRASEPKEAEESEEGEGAEVEEVEEVEEESEGVEEVNDSEEEGGEVEGSEEERSEGGEEESEVDVEEVSEEEGAKEDVEGYEEDEEEGGEEGEEDDDRDVVADKSQAFQVELRPVGERKLPCRQGGSEERNGGIENVVLRPNRRAALLGSESESEGEVEMCGRKSLGRRKPATPRNPLRPIANKN
ncbi:unnamed protein product [Closterium sp. Yama58-4]|nr:unnamed protein product [Closterium sp. Yama58-4]